jgi:hypothetical protein
LLHCGHASRNRFRFEGIEKRPGHFLVKTANWLLT